MLHRVCSGSMLFVQSNRYRQLLIAGWKLSLAPDFYGVFMIFSWPGNLLLYETHDVSPHHHCYWWNWDKYCSYWYVLHNLHSALSNHDIFFNGPWPCITKFKHGVNTLITNNSILKDKILLKQNSFFVEKLL